MMRHVRILFCIALLLLSACGRKEEEPVVKEEEIIENNTTMEDEKMLQMKIDDTYVEVRWEDNASVDALKELCKENEFKIQMSMYGGFEQVGYIGQDLPRDDVQTTTSYGDVVLYSGNNIVVFYGSNSWAYTRLGHIENMDQDQLRDLLGNGDVIITLYQE